MALIKDGTKDSNLFTIFRGSFGLAEASLALHNTFSIEADDTEEGAPELGHSSP